MVVDTLRNINLYKGLSPDIYAGLQFLANADENIELGVYPIIGLERVKWSPIKGMNINIPYDKSEDRTFFKDPSPQGTYVDIGNGIFAIMFPEDGHGPQHKVDRIEVIKKITIKISI